MTAILGGLGAAALWAAATLCSSRSSRMLGSRVVLAWVMIVGVIIGLPVALASPAEHAATAGDVAILALSGVCYVVGLQLTYAALKVGKVSIVAPIVATEGAIAATIAIVLGDPVTLAAASILGILVVGVILSSMEPARPDVAAGAFDVTADALEMPADLSVAAVKLQAPQDPALTRRTAAIAVVAALVFGVGLVAAGRSSHVFPIAWVALTGRLIGLVGVAIPLALRGRLTVTRRALPLVLVAGTGEVVGSMLSVWGSRESIAITAVMGSQFAAIAAVVAFLLFGERLGRRQAIGVLVIVIGVTALAAVQG